ncbi:MAG TPA: hypothetical protein VGZ29_02060 [Terriglobia bacterium]|nr:hypothetical protein [Terriglobia bacterium]
MPTPDDDQFETYLRQFRPVVPDPLPVASRPPVRLWLWPLAATAAVALVIAAALAMRLHHKPARSTGGQRPAAVEQLTSAQPLTLRRADDLLAHAPSFEAAMDGLAFQSEQTQVPPGSESALETLGKENLQP